MSSGQLIRDAKQWLDAYTHYRADRLDADYLCPFEGTLDGWIDDETDRNLSHWECPTCGHQGEEALR